LDAAAAVEAAGEQTHGSAHLFTGLGLLALVAAATRRRGVRLGLKAIVGVVLAASGLYFFPRLGLFSTPIAAWDLWAFGPSGFRSALYASFLPMLGAAVVFLGARRWQGLIIGLVVGFAANLLVGAVLMPTDVQLIPGLSSILDRLWLVLNAVILILLALLLRRRASA
jgi:serine protease